MNKIIKTVLKISFWISLSIIIFTHVYGLITNTLNTTHAIINLISGLLLLSLWFVRDKLWR